MKKVKIKLGDCLNLLDQVEPNSVDLLLCDLPFGTTQCKWDSCLPLEELWKKMWRVAKESAPAVMFASQPFTSVLVSSQIEYFRYEWIWEKSKASNFLDAKRKPLKSHESVLVFCRKAAPYFPQMTAGKPYKARPGKKVTDVYSHVRDNQFRNDNTGQRYPRSVLYWKTAESEGKVLHSTQKPVGLIEYLIKTYTCEGDLVLDPCIGSGTTAIASINLNRSCIGFEKDEDIFSLCMQRLDNLEGTHEI